MEEQLITAYAYTNLQKAVLANLLADIVAKENDPLTGLQGFYNDIKRDIQATSFPPGNLNPEEVRRQSLELAKQLFHDIQAILLRRGTVSETELSRWAY